jgi:glycosyltransferase involved in cell wall biosynthesis
MNPDVNRKDLYTLWEVYPHSDFITYPSLYEGFENAFLEAIYFKKPLLINRYTTFVKDIEPKGFDLIAMDGYLTRKSVQKVRDLLESAERREKKVHTNYEIASRHYSFAMLRRWLNTLLTNFFGVDMGERRSSAALAGGGFGFDTAFTGLCVKAALAEDLR